jgi:hypothetical protein
MKVKTRWRARVSIGLAPKRYVLNHEYVRFSAYEFTSKPIGLYDLVSVNPRMGPRLLSWLSKSPRTAEWQRQGFFTSAIRPRASIPRSPESRTHPPGRTLRTTMSSPLFRFLQCNSNQAGVPDSSHAVRHLCLHCATST